MGSLLPPTVVLCCVGYGIGGKRQSNTDRIVDQIGVVAVHELQLAAPVSTNSWNLHCDRFHQRSTLTGYERRVCVSFLHRNGVAVVGYVPSLLLLLAARTHQMLGRALAYQTDSRNCSRTD